MFEPRQPHQPGKVPSRPAPPGDTPASDTGPGRGVVVRSGAAPAVAAVVLVIGTAVWGWVPAASAAGSTVDVATSSGFGSILTDAQGFALYTFSMDHGGMSTCTGSCATVWPALTVPAGTTPTAGPGVTGTVAAVAQADGTDQVTYNGSPLYTFLTDPAPGQVTGNGVGGFSVVEVAAAPTPPTSSPTSPTTVTPAPASSPPPTSAPVSSDTVGTTPTKSAPAPSTAPAGSPAAASASGSPAPTGGPASGAPAALAFTGPGPALVVMGLVAVGLIALSLCLFVLVGDGSRRRATARAATQAGSRAGTWLLGR